MLLELLASETDDLEIIDQKIHENAFYQWLNKEDSPFFKIKKNLIKKNLVLPENHVLQTPAHIEFKYTLEYICCQLVEYYLSTDIMLNKMISHKSAYLKFRAMLASVKQYLDDQHLSLGNTVIEQLFKLTLNEIMHDDRKNVYISRKNAPTLLRDTFTKRAIGMLYPYYARYEDITNNFVTDTAIAITEQFFHTKSENHLANVALKVKKDLEENSLLINMTVEEFLIHLNSKKI